MVIVKECPTLDSNHGLNIVGMYRGISWLSAIRYNLSYKIIHKSLHIHIIYLN